MKLWPRLFYFVSGLLYPGALGVALTWFAQAATSYLTGGPSRPSLWSVFFVLWFLTYHSFLFVRLMDKHDRWCSEPLNYPDESYDWRGLVSDLLDCAVLFAVFAVLGFQPDTQGQSLGFGWLFVAAGGVPVSAFFANYGHVGRFRTALILLAIIAAIVGARANFCSFTHLDVWNFWLLVALWVLLATYVFKLYGKETSFDG